MWAELIQMFKPLPSPLAMAQKELIDAEHGRLTAQTAAEYAASVVTYHERRITRLNRYITDSKGVAT